MAGTALQFTWRPGAEPPRIESHSDAKLRLLAAYLDRYFDVVCALPQMDRLRIAFVDAFSGGGLFRGRDGTDRFGSPLAMLSTVMELNLGTLVDLHLRLARFRPRSGVSRFDSVRSLGTLWCARAPGLSGAQSLARRAMSFPVTAGDGVVCE